MQRARVIACSLDIKSCHSELRPLRTDIAALYRDEDQSEEYFLDEPDNFVAIYVAQSGREPTLLLSATRDPIGMYNFTIRDGHLAHHCLSEQTVKGYGSPYFLKPNIQAAAETLFHGNRDQMPELLTGKSTPIYHYHDQATPDHYSIWLAWTWQNRRFVAWIGIVSAKHFESPTANDYFWRQLNSAMFPGLPARILRWAGGWTAPRIGGELVDTSLEQLRHVLEKHFNNKLIICMEE